MIRFNNCKGFRLFRIGRYQAELWYCPKGEVIPMHTHKNVISRLVGVYGRMCWTVGKNTRSVIGCFRRRKSGGIALAAMRVDPNVSHGAIVSGRHALFLNLETWLTKPTSAALDFHEA